MQNVWQEVLRCVSRWELLQQIASGGPSDALLFAAPAEPVAAVKKRNFFSRAPRDGAAHTALKVYMSLYYSVLYNETVSCNSVWAVCMHLHAFLALQQTVLDGTLGMNAVSMGCTKCI